jgi:hypothetical protein
MFVQARLSYLKGDPASSTIVSIHARRSDDSYGPAGVINSRYSFLQD